MTLSLSEIIHETPHVSRNHPRNSKETLAASKKILKIGGQEISGKAETKLNPRSSQPCARGECTSYHPLAHFTFSEHVYYKLPY